MEVNPETDTKPEEEVPAVKDEAEAQEETPMDKEPASSSAGEVFKHSSLGFWCGKCN